MNTNTYYGECDRCGSSDLEPAMFTEEETKVESGIMHYTGRKRSSCSHLVCLNCGRNICVDGDFLAGPWHK